MPPLVGVAVKVTILPLQTGLEEVAMETETGVLVFTAIVMAFEDPWIGKRNVQSEQAERARSPATAADRRRTIALQVERGAVEPLRPGVRHLSINQRLVISRFAYFTGRLMRMVFPA